MKNKDKKIEVLKMVAEDMRNDAENFDGKPFNVQNLHLYRRRTYLFRRTVAEYFGHQGAAISAIANILRSILEEE